MPQIKNVQKQVNNEKIPKRQKRKLFQYAPEQLERVLEEIKENRMGIREASRQFSIPKTTIIDCVKSRVLVARRKTGPEPILTVKLGVFNGDESGFSLCPKSGKVLAPKGWKNLYQIKLGSDKENLTVLIVFSANGIICPDLVVFPYIRPPHSMPPNHTLSLFFI
ncbi:helix-turn-helix psq domain [Holotrichia oblita]|uniref:Helix-turn-helix psq domain n=1 Tax=Holotrichia oblita TaxID=644536 RepID=A0ACB9TZD7_HOLOL|nr:helix-turn-helix psq domain [Holotrichia oblita]